MHLSFKTEEGISYELAAWYLFVNNFKGIMANIFSTWTAKFGFSIGHAQRVFWKTSFKRKHNQIKHCIQLFYLYNVEILCQYPCTMRKQFHQISVLSQLFCISWSPFVVSALIQTSRQSYQPKPISYIYLVMAIFQMQFLHLQAFNNLLKSLKIESQII